MADVVNLPQKFSAFSDHWQPKRVARLNDYDVRLVKVQGEFVWHKHDDTDELFFVHKGTLHIEYRDRRVTLTAGELHVVPRGVEHKPVAEAECEVMLLEPSAVVNTGDAGGERTAVVQEL